MGPTQGFNRSPQKTAIGSAPRAAMSIQSFTSCINAAVCKCVGERVESERQCTATSWVWRRGSLQQSTFGKLLATAPWGDDAVSDLSLASRNGSGHSTMNVESAAGTAASTHTHHRQTDKQTDRQTGRQAGRQADRQTDRERETHTHTQTDTHTHTRTHTHTKRTYTHNKCFDHAPALQQTVLTSKEVTLRELPLAPELATQNAQHQASLARS